MGPRRSSTTELFQAGQEADIEYFFASDASAIIEHTNRVIYLEDDDVAAIRKRFFKSDNDFSSVNDITRRVKM